MEWNSIPETEVAGYYMVPVTKLQELSSEPSKGKELLFIRKKQRGIAGRNRTAILW